MGVGREGAGGQLPPQILVDQKALPGSGGAPHYYLPHRIFDPCCTPEKVIFGVPEIPPLLGVWGAWMTFKKAVMAKTLRNGLSMIETNNLNHNWLDFAI